MNTTKVAYGSDLHLEFGQLDCELPDADVLVLCGDIINAYDIRTSKKFHRLYDRFFTRVSSKYDKVICIMGNHEHYEGNYEHTYNTLKDFYYDYGNVILLENQTYDYNDVKFIGSTLWTEIEEHDRFTIERMMSDYKVINYSSDDHKLYDRIQMDHIVSRDFIFDEAKNSDSRVNVVLSHHAPCGFSISSWFTGDVLNPAYFTELSNKIMDNGKINYWIHGHVHDVFDYEIDKTRVLCNPRGYIGYEQIAKQYKFKVIEV